MQIVSVLMRILAAILGLGLFFVCALLDPAEEEQVDRALDRAVTVARSAKTSVIGKGSYLLRLVCFYVTCWLDRVYGPRLFSFRAVSISVLVLAAALGGSIVALMLPLVRLTSLGVFSYWAAAGVMGIVLAGDVLTVAATRRLLAVSRKRHHLLVWVIALIVCVLLAGFAEFPPLLLRAPDDNMYHDLFSLMWMAMAVPSLIPILALIALSTALAANILLWPILVRLLSSVRRHRILFERRKWFIGLSILLVSLAISPQLVNPKMIAHAIAKELGIDVKSTGTPEESSED